ncbi:DUF4032 domain-containing protein [Rhodopirellula sp. MGV]|uniref:DUF4032 domain-containing protein n=1 Tax=Rhodopirellula sp. MGV TaxID=2023130 RepID=UPI000B967D52|nr:DUF4032 domain-containing protein [Rhodopirellula sp. MGV]OYP35950.1 hypothetical protein CGZ80_09290 [Rhodopirellula sp. MGV]PNY34875.1 DUF4032 domain-containing protein [Rhodopirellula baltica]
MQDFANELSEQQIEEIDRHKYFLSERAGHDVGWEFALQDWRQNVAEPELEGEDQTLQTPMSRIGGFLKRLLSKAAMM